MARKIINITALAGWLALIAVGFLLVQVSYGRWPFGSTRHYSVAQKADEQCTGQETTGRCADKCPNPDEYVMAYDKQTGAAICRKVTGCPYGDSIPQDSPKCAPEPISPAQPAYLPQFGK